VRSPHWTADGMIDEEVVQEPNLMLQEGEYSHQIST